MQLKELCSVVHRFHTDLFWPLRITMAHASSVTVTPVAVLSVPQNSSAFGHLTQGLAHGFVLK